MAKPRMNEKQKMFADEYIANGGNVHQAALKAGYSESHAKSTVYKLLDNPRIKSYIAERLKTIQSARTMRAEEALALVSAIARGEENVDGKLPNNQTRLKAAETLLKVYGQFTDKVEINGNVDIASVLKKAKDRANKAK